MAPLFSIILPTYNRAKMVRTALKTVQYQTMGDWECLVVDDGSTDGTREALEEFKGDPRIRVLRSDGNRGMNASRNSAIAESRGKLVTFLDSDDLWLPRRLEGFRDRLEGSPEAGFLFSNAYVWRFGRILGMLFDPGRSIPEGKLPGHYAVGERHLPYVTTNVAIRRDAFDRSGLFKTQMKTLDTELFARFVGGGLPVAVIRSPLSVRRIHEGQLTDRHVENFKESLLALESSGASDDVRGSMRREICREVAVYLVKSGEASRAREFLLQELGRQARSTPEFRLTYLPAPVLRLGKELRRRWLMLRHHPAWASRDVREVYQLIDPLLADERGRSG
jgi:glycosyltransferase involved in cell wall biosynthesis